MTIATSTFALGPIQKSGLRYCIEKHTDNTGIVHIIEYLSDLATDNNAVMVARAVFIDQQLKNTEINNAIFNNPWNMNLVYATNTELSVYVRNAYKESSKETLALIAKRILEWIVNGRFTDVQIRNAFGLSAAQWTTLKTKMQALFDNYNAIQNGVGE